MRRILATLAIMTSFLLPAAVLADGCSGFACENACPLAKSANQRRATGTESAKLSVDLRKEVADTVLANLKKI